MSNSKLFENLKIAFSGKYLLVASLVIIVLIGAGLRFLDFTEPPLDFHPTRQLHSALIARDFYYQLNPTADELERQEMQQLASAEAKYEPPLMELMAAVGYLAIGKETLWVPRLLSIIFWLGGAIPLYILAKNIAGMGGAVATLGYYLLLPLSVELSRSFQPDSLMVLFLILFVFALYRWTEGSTMSWAISAGILGGIAVLLKGRPAPIVGLIALVGVGGNIGLPKAFKNFQVWVMALLMVLIPFAYYFGPFGPSTAGLIGDFTGNFAGLLKQPWFYVRWLDFVDGLFNLALVFIGAASIIYFKQRSRWIMLGWMMGYVIYGLYLPYNIYTHSYYSAPLIPLVALSLAPMSSWFWTKASANSLGWRLVALAILAFGLFKLSWSIRSGILGTDYHAEVIGWRKMGRELPEYGNIVALTHDYGTRVAYYGQRAVSVWPTSDDYEFRSLQGGVGKDNFDHEFQKRTSDADYFLVTLLGEFDRQQDLKQKLTQEYELLIDGDGYLLFDLRQ